jgi:hypothetical protein
MTTKNKRQERSMIDGLTDDKALVKNTAARLLAYCRANNWAGYDPYDALNSRLFKALPFLDFKLARLTLTQTVKRCPVNLRPLLLVPKSPNPKGIALFLSALTRLTKAGVNVEEEALTSMAGKLLAMRSPGQAYSSWGYNFDWQSRAELVPYKTPNIICSTFSGNALLDAYEKSKEPSWLEAAISAAQFILDKLFWREGSLRACFSYTPLGRTEIHNANLLGASFLARVSQIQGQGRFLGPAMDAARYSVSHQHADGSWDYGELTYQRWIDNFHTGFNLVALKRLKEYGETTEFDPAIRRGFDFYRAHFFSNDGMAKYYHNTAYPIDIHSISQSLITLVEFASFKEDNIRLASEVLHWTMDNMWDPRGFFYFQKRQCGTVRTPFMRWSQAWMLLALSRLLEETSLSSQ